MCVIAMVKLVFPAVVCSGNFTSTAALDCAGVYHRYEDTTIL